MVRAWVRMEIHAPTWPLLIIISFLILVVILLLIFVAIISADTPTIAVVVSTWGISGCGRGLIWLESAFSKLREFTHSPFSVELLLFSPRPLVVSLVDRFSCALHLLSLR